MMTKEELNRHRDCYDVGCLLNNVIDSHLEANAEIEHLNTVIIKTLENTIIRLTGEFEAEIEKLKATLGGK